MEPQFQVSSTNCTQVPIGRRSHRYLLHVGAPTYEMYGVEHANCSTRKTFDVCVLKVRAILDYFLFILGLFKQCTGIWQLVARIYTHNLSDICYPPLSSRPVPDPLNKNCNINLCFAGYNHSGWLIMIAKNEDSGNLL